MDCPYCFDIAFARELVEHLGGDPSPMRDDWCWTDMGRHYRKLRPKAEDLRLTP
jgi:hypothetical protein